MEDTVKKVADLIEIFKSYESQRSNWAQHAQLNREYRYGRQRTQQELSELIDIGRSTAIDNKILPAVEMGKALLTASRPRYKALPRESSDAKVANVLEGLLEYHWDISNGTMQLRTIVDDYYTAGAGWALIYSDPEADCGKGEVYFVAVDPDDVYCDPYARDRLIDDAERICISRRYTKGQAKRLLRKYKTLVDKAGSGTDFGTADTTTDRTDDFMTHFPGDIQTTQMLTGDDEEVRMYRFFSKTDVDVMNIYQSWDGGELALYSDQIMEKMNSPVWVVNNVPITDSSYATILIREVLESYKMGIQQYEEAVQTGQIDPATPPPVAPTIEETTYGNLIKMEGMARVVTRSEVRIRETMIVGETLIYERVLPSRFYPLVPFFNMHTRTPYPTSDVSMARGLQDYINVLQSLIVAHAQQATNLKVLIPSGSVDLEEFEKKWRTPGVAIEIDMEDGHMPILVPPAPLPNELFLAQQRAASAIDHQFGLYRLMMGDSEAAPSTNAATLNIDHFGQRKSKSKLADIEESLRRCAIIALENMAHLFRSEKRFRVVNHNNTVTEYAINSGLVDEKAPTIAAIGNLDAIKYDIQIVTGSTLPTNYMAELELHTNLLTAGAIDKVELWKHTPIYDAEGLAKRFSEIEQLTAALKQAEEKIKGLEGDMQTRDREVKHLNDAIALEKTKSSLKGIEATTQAAATVAAARMGDAVNTLSDAVSQRNKEKESK